MLYDDDCGFCRWSAARLRSWDRGGRLRFTAIQGGDGSRLLSAIPARERLDAMHAVTPDGRVWTGGGALTPILGALPGGGPLAAVSRAAPGLTEWLYRTVAHRRDWLGALVGRQACAVDPSRIEL